MAMATKKKGRDSCKSTTSATGQEDTALTLQPVKGEPRIDSRVLAQPLRIQHESVPTLLTAYADDCRELGIAYDVRGVAAGRCASDGTRQSFPSYLVGPHRPATSPLRWVLYFYA